ncbi:hypothetical protein FH972_012344 [Carpinus fangiana]|uniref:Uncharacterized protein n=1 Tax=Carpinus fangiana TaxID=176857 RepID=A0A5N6R3I0_9ROSI|nr:hypothetical protein FH972_012344 [Carpinus fangiana]
MRCNIDLRYGVPAAISLIFVLLPSEDNPWINQNDNLGINPIFVVVVAIVVMLFFLFTSINLPLTLEPIFLMTRHFSLSWTLSLLASLLFPPSHFWLLFPILVLLSPWDTCTMLLDCFHTTLQALPARITLCVPQCGQEPADPPPSDQLEIAVIENESNNTCVVEIEVIENGGS